MNWIIRAGSGLPSLIWNHARTLDDARRLKELGVAALEGRSPPSFRRRQLPHADLHPARAGDNDIQAAMPPGPDRDRRAAQGHGQPPAEPRWKPRRANKAAPSTAAPESRDHAPGQAAATPARPSPDRARTTAATAPTRRTAARLRTPLRRAAPPRRAGSRLTAPSGRACGRLADAATSSSTGKAKLPRAACLARGKGRPAATDAARALPGSTCRRRRGRRCGGGLGSGG